MAEHEPMAPSHLNKDYVPVRRGFGSFDLSELADDQCVTASGLRDGGYIVWEEKRPLPRFPKRPEAVPFIERPEHLKLSPYESRCECRHGLFSHYMCGGASRCLTGCGCGMFKPSDKPLKLETDQEQVTGVPGRWPR